MALNVREHKPLVNGAIHLAGKSPGEDGGITGILKIAGTLLTTASCVTV